MKRDDPLLLPICQVCGKYKGVGPCNDSSCLGSKITTGGEDSLVKSQPAKKSCSLCDNESVLSCSRCNRGYCETHGTGRAEGQLVKLDQRVGTCSICNQIVCENCWILEGDGAITCLEHHESGPRHHE